MKNIYTSIDIGSNSIKVVVCEYFNNKLNLLASSSVESKGIKKGLIINANEAASSIKRAISEAEGMLGIKIKKLTASIPSNFAEFTFVKGDIKITNDDGIITSDDIVKVFNKAGQGKLEGPKEMVSIIPIDFIIDDKHLVKNPLGKSAKAFGVKAIMVSVPAKNISSVLAVIDSLGIEVVDIMINSIGDMSSLKNRETNKEVGAIINLGAETINISLYNRGIVVKNVVLGVGGSIIDEDISKKYKISLEDAKNIKEKFALASRKHASVGEYYEVKTNIGDSIRITQTEVSTLVSKRLEDILDLCNREIKGLSNVKLDYITFTGGLSNITYFDFLVKEKLGDAASVGSVKMIGVRDNIYSSVVGNVIYFINKLKLKSENYSMVSREDTEDLSSVKKNSANVISDAMFNKVVGYFFGD